MLRDFLLGVGCLLDGYRCMWRRGLRGIALAPLAVNVLLFTAGALWLVNRVPAWESLVQTRLPGWMDWLAWLLWPLVLAVVLIVVYLGFTAMTALIASPLLGSLAARAGRLLAGVTLSPQAGGWREIALAPLQEIRKLLYFGTRAAALLVLGFVPVINLGVPALWILFGAWSLALEYADFPLGNEGLDLRAQRALLRRRPMPALGFGMAVLVATVVPVVNLMVVPAATVGAALLCYGVLGAKELSGESLSRRGSYSKFRRGMGNRDTGR